MVLTNKVGIRAIIESQEGYQLYEWDTELSHLVEHQSH